MRASRWRAASGGRSTATPPCSSARATACAPRRGSRSSARGAASRRTRDRLHRAPALAVERKRAALDAAAGKLRLLSPSKTLDRGYAIVRTESGLVRSAHDVAPGVRVEVAVAEGGFGARVEDVRE